MVWWLFKKKKEHPYLNLLKQMEEGLIHSFGLIKKDVGAITKKLDHHDNHIKEIHKRLEALETIKIVKEELSEEKPEIKETLPIAATSTQGKQLVWEDLTEVQQSLFWRLGTLQIESNQPWISTKYLSEELYPDKDYKSVRSMISDYINILSDYGLLKKTRKGRQTYTTLSKKGIKFFDKNKQKKLLQVLEREE